MMCGSTWSIFINLTPKHYSIMRKKKYMEYTLNDKIKLLGLSSSRVLSLNSIKVKDANYNLENINKRTNYAIDLDKLIGTTRHVGDITWLEVLDKFCHKSITFEKYTSEVFKNFIEKPNGDYPHVYKKDDNYYIVSDGFHRLTIAKCIGLQKAYCIVDEE